MKKKPKFIEENQQNPKLVFDINVRASRQLKTFADKVVHNPDFKSKTLIKKSLVKVLDAWNSSSGMALGPVSTDLGKARGVVRDEKFVLTIIPPSGKYVLYLTLEVVDIIPPDTIVEYVVDASWFLI